METIIPTVTTDLESQALTLVDEAHDLTLLTTEDFRLADQYLSRNKAMQQSWEEFTRPSCEAAHTSWKSAIAVRDRVLNPLREWEQTIKRKMAEWRREQERIRVEAERQANEEARLAAAVEAEQAGENGHAEALLNETAMVPPVILPPVKPAGTKTGFRETWKAQVTDFPVLVKAVAEGKAPMTLLLVNHSALDQLAKALKQGFRVPGCAAYAETIVSGRRT